MAKLPTKYRAILIHIVLALAAFVAYEPVRHNDFVNYDDDIYVTENPHVSIGLTRQSLSWAFTKPHCSLWHPLTSLSHILDCHLFGLNPRWHHTTSLLLHICSTLLLFAIFNKMTGAVWQSAFVAALFALHPLQVESVAWVAERKNVLSGFFWMLTIAAYIRYAERPAVGRYFLVAFTFGLALMAKPTVVTLPFVLLLLDYWPLHRFQWAQQNAGDSFSEPQSLGTEASRLATSRLLGEKIPLFILSAIVSVITVIAQQSAGILAQAKTLPVITRLANALCSYAAYLVKMAWPTNLAVFYPYPKQLRIDGAILLLVVISILVIRLARRRHWLIVGWLWYLGTLVPVIGLVQAGAQAMADRYTYLPSIGIYLMVAWGAAELLAKLRRRSTELAIAAVLLLAILLISTRRQVSHWHNNITLFGHAIEVTKDNYVMHDNYGASLLKNGRLDEALEHFEQALRIHPGFARARMNIGNVFLEKGELDKAIEYFNKALSDGIDCPEIVCNNLGLACFRKGDYNRAIQNYNEALRIRPDFTDAQNNLKNALLLQNNLNKTAP